MAVIDLKNWRFHPFTNVVHDITITDELHTIQYHDDWNAYGIQTNEMPLFENPTSLSIRKVSDSSLFTEVPRSQAPQPGEYRVDYDGETYFGTGRCEFNIGDNGIAVKVTYQGTGSVIKNRNTLGASTFPADVVVDGETTLSDDTLVDADFEVTGLATFATSTFASAPTIQVAPTSATDAVRKDYVDTNTPVGSIYPFAGISTPSGWLLCNGSAISRITYSSLFGIISVSKGTCTISIASPGVVTLNGHGLLTGDCISFTTTGALPTGLSVNTNYYVIYNDANSFWVATTYANAIGGTKIDTSGSQSGDHTLRYNPYGISGANDFLLPDMRGINLQGNGQQGTSAWASADYKGGLGHYIQDQFQGFAISYDRTIRANNTGNLVVDTMGSGALATTTSSIITDGTNGTPRVGKITRAPVIGVNFIIKY